MYKEKEESVVTWQLYGLDGLGSLGTTFEQVAGDAVIGNLEDGSGIVLFTAMMH